jgi:hypothetical protein
MASFWRLLKKKRKTSIEEYNTGSTTSKKLYVNDRRNPKSKWKNQISIPMASFWRLLKKKWKMSIEECDAGMTMSEKSM